MHAPAYTLLASALAAGAAADVWTNGVWVEREPLPFGRSDMSIDFFGASVYIAGGCNGAQNCDSGSGYCSCSSITDDLVLYRADLDTYTSLPHMPVNRYRHISCPWRDSIYFFGGRTLSTDSIIRQVRGQHGEMRCRCYRCRCHRDTRPPATATSSRAMQIDVFNTTTRTWSTLPGSSDYPGGSDNGCFTIDDTIYLTGGYAPDYSESYNTTWAFTPATGAWTTKAGQLRYGRGDFSAVTLNGKGYIYGGYQVGDFCSPIAFTEEYHPHVSTASGARRGRGADGCCCWTEPYGSVIIMMPTFTLPLLLPLPLFACAE